MAGVFNGVVDLFSGGGGGPESGVSGAVTTQNLNNQLWLQDLAKQLLATQQTSSNAQSAAQQSLLPEVYRKFGLEPQYDEFGRVTSFNGSAQTPETQVAAEQMGLGNQQTGLQQANQANLFNLLGYDLGWGQGGPGGQGQASAAYNPNAPASRLQQYADQAALSSGASLPAQYQNMGYTLDANGVPVESPDSARNTFARQMGSQYGQGQQVQQQNFGTLNNLYGQGQQLGQQNLNLLNQQYGFAGDNYNQAAQRYGQQYGFAGDVYNQTANQLQQQYGTAGNLLNQNLGLLDQQYGVAGDVYNRGMEELGPNSAAQNALNYTRNATESAAQLRNPSLERLGIRAVTGPNGEFQGYQNDANSNEMRARTLAGDFLTRAQAAAQGNAQVNPGLQRQLAEEENILRNKLAASLGADYATSTPGMAALADFSKRRAEVLYDQQQQDMLAGVNSYNTLNNAGLNSLNALYGVNQPLLQASGQYGQQAQNLAGARNQVGANYLAQAGNITGLRGQIGSDYLNQARAISGAQNQAGANYLGQTGAITSAQNQAGGNYLNQVGNIVNQRGQTMNDLFGQGMNFVNANAANAGMLSPMALNEAQGMIGFQQANQQGFNAAPQATQQALANAQNMRLNTYNALMGTSQPVLQAAQFRQPYGAQGTTAATLQTLFGGLGAGYGDTGLGQLAGIAGNISSGAGNTGLSAEKQRFGGAVNADESNMNNIFWRNVGQSAGQSFGSAAGGIAGAKLGQAVGGKVS